MIPYTPVTCLALTRKDRDQKGQFNNQAENCPLPNRNEVNLIYTCLAYQNKQDDFASILLPEDTFLHCSKEEMHHYKYMFLNKLK